MDIKMGFYNHLKKSSEPKINKFSTEFWMLLPSMVVLAGLSIYPFIYLLQMGFMKFSLMPGQPSRFIGLENWIRMFNDGDVLFSWIVTLIYFIGALLGEVIIGIGVALLLDRYTRFQGLLVSMAISPMFLAPMLVGLLWRFLLHDSYGIYTYFLHRLGFFKDLSVFGSAAALPVIILMDIWEWSPLISLIFLAGLKTVPFQLYEASALDGATSFQQLKYITLPVLKKVILVSILIRVMDLVRYFDTIMITTRGGPADLTKILAVRIFENTFKFFNIGYASVLGLSLLIFTIILSKLFLKFFVTQNQE